MKASRILPRHSGFALAELLVVIAAVAVLASMALSTMQGVQQTARTQKLATDVQTVNNAVQMYITSGGNLTGVTDANVVLERLKTDADAATAGTILGMRRNFLDDRVIAIWQTSQEASTSMARANWNGTSFVVTNSGSNPGIREFAYDEAVATAVTTEARTVSKASTDSGWVWSYGAAEVAAPGRASIDPALGSTPGGIGVLQQPGTLGAFEIGGSGVVQMNYVFRQAGYNGRLALVSLEGMEVYDLTTDAGRRDYMLELVRRVVENDRGQVIIDASIISAGAAQQTYYFRPGDVVAPVLIPDASFAAAYAAMQSGIYSPLTYPITTINMGVNAEPFYQNQIASLGNNGYSIEDLTPNNGSDYDYDDMVFTLAGVNENPNSQFNQIDPNTYYQTRLGQLGRDYWNNSYQGGPSLRQALTTAGIIR